MSSKRKPAHQEARERLQEKVTDVRSKSEKLHAIINSIADQPISHADEVLKEKSKTKFLAKYSKVSQELEGCLNQLLLVTDAIASLDGSDDENEESSEDDDDDDTDMVSVMTNDTSVTLERLDSQETLPPRYGSHESLISVISVTECTYTNDLKEEIPDHSEVSVAVPKYADATTKEADAITKDADEIPKDAGAIYQMLSLDSQTKDVDNKDSFPTLTSITVEPFKWEMDVPYPIIVTNVNTPMDFFVQLINPENDLMEQLCMHFMKEASDGYYGGINFVPSPNMFCCAKSCVDGAWYRAKILLIHNQPNDRFGCSILEEVSVKVFFIDEGYAAFVNLSSIRPLEKQFSILPAQAVNCILGGVQPIEATTETKTLSFVECNSMWLAPSLSMFNKLVTNGNICTSYFYYPPTAAYQSPHNVSHDTLACDLYIVNTGTKVPWWKLSVNRMPIEDHIAFKLIVNRMAAHCSFFKSELSSKKSKKVLEQYINPEASDVSDVVPNVEIDKEAEVTKQESHLTNYIDSTGKEHYNDTHQVIKSEEIKPEVLTPPAQDKRDSKKIVPKVVDNKVIGTSKKDDKSKRIDENHFFPDASAISKKRSASPEKYDNERQKRISDKNQRLPADKKTDVNKNQKIPVDKRSSKGKSYNRPPSESDIKSDIDSVVKINGITKPSSPVEFKYFQFGSSFEETILTPEPEGFAKVLVSEVVNPGLIYVHLVTPEVVLLDKLMTELNIYYNEKVNEIRSYWNGMKHEPGTAVVCLFDADMKWYRALILSTRTTSKGKREYNILFVDFGSGEWISEDLILPIIAKFCELPMEIIACCLADIKPCSSFVTKQIKGVTVRPAGFESPDDDTDSYSTDSNNVVPKWPEKATSRVKILILTQLPMMVSLKNVFKNSDGLYEVYLYDTADNKDVFINQLLVDEGLASSDVFCKIAPSVQVSELELEERIVESKAMTNWDPMKEQYISKRNVYSVDTDNVGVASLGYVDKNKSICNNFVYRGHCYRGDNCKYVHAHPGDPILDSVEVFCDDTILDLPETKKCVPVIIRALLDATHFWVNFPYGIDWCDVNDDNDDHNNCGNLSLERLHNNMELYYSKLGHSRKTNLSLLAEGELVAAKFHEDSRWYRARVINTADDLVQVFYVDYGNTDVITEDNTNELVSEFLVLPFQAVECFLFNTYLKEEVLPTDQTFIEMRMNFRDMVADKVLMAYIVSTSITKSIVVMLYDTTTEPHTYINEIVRNWDGIVHSEIDDFDLKAFSDETKPKRNTISYLPG